MSWRTNHKTKRPFIVTVVNRPLAKATKKYGKTLAQSAYNPATGEMELYAGASPASMEHELGHLKIRRFGDYISPEEKKKISRELKKEHKSRFWAYDNTYYRDNVEEAIAETFAAKKYGWKNSELGFDPAHLTPKIWAFVKRVDKKFG